MWGKNWSKKGVLSEKGAVVIIGHTNMCVGPTFQNSFLKIDVFHKPLIIKEFYFEKTHNSSGGWLFSRGSNFLGEN